MGRKTQSKPAPTIHVQMDYKDCKILFVFKSRIQWLHVEKDHVCSLQDSIMELTNTLA